ncbi:MAG: hypothetical protein KAH48_12325 [Chlorobi bacterium]|nr:hypothetical protein [Chlorobiota bacterium]
MKLFNVLAAVFSVMILLVFSSCAETTSVAGEAELVSESEILTTPGFEEWYQTDLDAYSPDPSVINDIKTVFDADKHKFVLFASSCGTCVGDQSDFAIMMKIIHEADIPVSYYQLYSIVKASYKQPYESRFSLHFLPSCFILKDDEAVYSIADTMIYMKYKYPDAVPTYEQLFLSGLLK